MPGGFILQINDTNILCIGLGAAFAGQSVFRIAGIDTVGTTVRAPGCIYQHAPSDKLVACFGLCGRHRKINQLYP